MELKAGGAGAGVSQPSREILQCRNGIFFQGFREKPFHVGKPLCLLRRDLLYNRAAQIWKFAPQVSIVGVSEGGCDSMGRNRLLLSQGLLQKPSKIDALTDPFCVGLLPQMAPARLPVLCGDLFREIRIHLVEAFASSIT
jgi:hypothetical protein